MKTQIPIYRAKKTDSDEYVEGYLMPYACIDGWFIRLLKYDNLVDAEIEIGPSTLAIHFPNMIANDSDKLLPNGEKDLRIFASLSEDGKGGDILEHEYYPLGAIYPYYYHKVFIFKNGILHVGKTKHFSGYEHTLAEITEYEKLKDILPESNFMLKKYKVIGIQK